MKRELPGGRSGRCDFAGSDSLSQTHGSASTMACRCRSPIRSAWIYAHAGVAGGKAASPLGSFYFGSFRNNYVDNRPEKRYREIESFPGFEIDQIDARRFVKLTGEVNLPPVRFAEIGTPAIYLSYASPGPVRRHHADPRRGRPRTTIITTSADRSISISPSRCACR